MALSENYCKKIKKTGENMKNEGKKSGVRVSLLFKVTVVFCILLAVTVVLLEIMNIYTIRTSNMEPALIMRRNKIIGDIASFEEKIGHEYGKLSLRNGDLVDERFHSIKNDYSVVDYIASSHGVHATIFMKDNQDYRRIATSIINSNGKRAVDTFLGSASAAFSPIQSGNDFFGNTDILGKNYLAAYKPLFANNSREVIGILFIGFEMSPVEEYITNTRNTNMINAAIEGMIILLAAAIITFFLARSFVKPIVRITNTLRDISEGEGDLTQRINISSKDEVGMLALYFNLTLDKIKHLVISIKHEITVLSEIGDSLANDMNETAAAVNEIATNISSMKERVHKQSTTVSETHKTMEELTGNIHKLDTHVENQSSHISRSSAAIEEMVANVHSVTNTLIKNNTNVRTLREASEVGRTGLSDVAADIQEIARESEGLLEINSVMENIASQTNLLSMNAAIEAAHAGEAGKGFAVVADEIRKLAESSSEQSKTISTVLKKIKESIDKITRSTDNVLGKFEDIDSSVRIVSEQEEVIRTAMEEQGVGSQQILNGIEEVNEITRMVKSDSNDMLQEAQEVIQESNSLDQATQEINSGMVEMTLGVDHINIAMADVNEISVKNREGIEDLIREVARFKVE